MATKQIVLSDISGDELADDQHVRLVIDHPDFPRQELEIDCSVDEAEKFQNTSLRLVNVQVYAPNVPARTVTVETKILDRLFDKTDFNKVLEGARRAESRPIARQAAGRPRK